MSRTDRETLAAITRHVVDRGYPPSIRELGAALGLRSTCGVQYRIGRLERRGLITRKPFRSRTLRVVGRGAP